VNPKPAPYLDSSACALCAGRGVERRRTMTVLPASLIHK
jgi:hypothetical protein